MQNLGSSSADTLPAVERRATPGVTPSGAKIKIIQQPTGSQGEPSFVETTEKYERGKEAISVSD